MALKEHLHGFDVTKDGRLRFWCHPKRTSLYVSEVKGFVPENFVLEGPAAVEKYVESCIAAAVDEVVRKHLERQKKLDSVRVELAILHGSVPLRGVITNTIYGGQAVWDIHLTEPLGYEGRDTLCCRKYPAHTPDNELLSRDCEPTFYALDLGKRKLVELYEKRRHEKMFPIVHDVFRKLKLAKQESV